MVFQESLKTIVKKIKFFDNFRFISLLKYCLDILNKLGQRQGQTPISSAFRVKKVLGPK